MRPLHRKLCNCHLHRIPAFCKNLACCQQNLGLGRKPYAAALAVEQKFTFFFEGLDEAAT